MELSITLEKSCYFPGELLKCLVKVGVSTQRPGGHPLQNTTQQSEANLSSRPSLLRAQVKKTQPDSSSSTAAGPDAALELLFECSGSERVDPSWVGRLYHPEVTAQKDNKVCVGLGVTLVLCPAACQHTSTKGDSRAQSIASQTVLCRAVLCCHQWC